MLGMHLGWAFLNEFDTEHGIVSSNMEDGVHEKNGGNIKAPQETGSVDSAPTSVPDFHAPATASSTIVSSDEPDMAQLLPKCMEEDLKVALRCQTCLMRITAVSQVCLCHVPPGSPRMHVAGAYNRNAMAFPRS